MNKGKKRNAIEFEQGDVEAEDKYKAIKPQRAEENNEEANKKISINYFDGYDKIENIMNYFNASQDRYAAAMDESERQYDRLLEEIRQQIVAKSEQDLLFIDQVNEFIQKIKEENKVIQKNNQQDQLASLEREKRLAKLNQNSDKALEELGLLLDDTKEFDAQTLADLENKKLQELEEKFAQMQEEITSYQERIDILQNLANVQISDLENIDGEQGYQCVIKARSDPEMYVVFLIKTISDEAVKAIFIENKTSQNFDLEIDEELTIAKKDLQEFFGVINEMLNPKTE